MSGFGRSECYASRPAASLGVREIADGWRLEVYSIAYGDDPIELGVYEEGLELAAARLPRPAVGEHRPGVGVVIFHRGRGVHYLVMGWWDNENEIPMMVLVRGFGDDARWRPAGERESVCVWDLAVLWHEREAYVRHVLGPAQGPDIERYLSDCLVSGTV